MAIPPSSTTAAAASNNSKPQSQVNSSKLTLPRGDKTRVQLSQKELAVKEGDSSTAATKQPGTNSVSEKIKQDNPETFSNQTGKALKKIGETVGHVTRPIVNTVFGEPAMATTLPSGMTPSLLPGNTPAGIRSAQGAFEKIRQIGQKSADYDAALKKENSYKESDQRELKIRIDRLNNIPLNSEGWDKDNIKFNNTKTFDVLKPKEKISKDMYESILTRPYLDIVGLRDTGIEDKNDLNNELKNKEWKEKNDFWYANNLELAQKKRVEAAFDHYLKTRKDTAIEGFPINQQIQAKSYSLLKEMTGRGLIPLDMRMTSKPVSLPSDLQKEAAMLGVEHGKTIYKNIYGKDAPQFDFPYLVHQAQQWSWKK
jgi:hypothetical protein